MNIGSSSKKLPEFTPKFGAGFTIRTNIIGETREVIAAMHLDMAGSAVRTCTPAPAVRLTRNRSIDFCWLPSPQAATACSARGFLPACSRREAASAAAARDSQCQVTTQGRDEEHGTWIKFLRVASGLAQSA